MADTMKFLDLAGLQTLWGRINDVFVRKDGNKVLSDNNYTNDDKNKLASIAEGAQVNVVEGLQVTNGTDKLAFANDPVDSKTWVIKNVTDLADTQGNVLAPTAATVATAIDAAKSAANTYADGLVKDAEGKSKFDAAGSAAAALESANTYTDEEIAKLTNAEGGILANAKAYTNSVVGDLPEGSTTVVAAIDAAKSAANAYADSLVTVDGKSKFDAAGSADAALDEAKTYADGLVKDAEGKSKFDAAGSAAQALADAKADTTKQIAALDLPNTYDAKGAAATALEDAKDYTDGKIDEVKALVTASTQFLGVADNEIKVDGDDKTGATIKVGGEDVTASAGDIVLYGTSEFIWDGAAWVLLGDTTAEMGAITDLQTAVNTTLPNAITKAQTDAQAYADSLAKNYDEAGAAAAAETAAKAYADSLAKNYDEAGAAAKALEDANDYTNSVVGDLGTATTVKDYVDAAKEAAIAAAAGNITADSANEANPTGEFTLVSEVSKDGKTVAAKTYTFAAITADDIAKLS